MKYLERLIAREKQARGVGVEHVETGGTTSAKSAKSSDPPPFGTFGTSIPGRVSEIGPLSPWSEHVHHLLARPAPDGVSAVRWLRLIDDAAALEKDWGVTAAALGWSALDLWGCNSDPAAHRLDHDGLALLLDGRRVVAITANTAAIAASNGHTLVYRRHSMAGSVLLWDV